MQAAYQGDKFHTVVETTLPTNRYDFIAKLVPPRQRHKAMPANPNWTMALQREIKRKFGVIGSWEMRNADVLIVKPIATGTKGFKISHTMPNGVAVKTDPGNYSYHEQSLDTLVSELQQRFQIPIIDQTELTQDYDFALKWDEPNPDRPNNESLKSALRDQLGLELVPTNTPIKMLVVEKAK